MKKKTAIIIEVYEELEIASTQNTATKRLEVYTDYADGYGFGTVLILPSVNQRNISTFLTTVNSLLNDGFTIKIKFINEKDFNEEKIKELLH